MKPGKLICIAAVAFGSLAAGSAWSQDAGFYVGGFFGRSDMKDACEGTTIPCDKTDKSWKIVGGYQFNRNLAAEIGYVDLGEAIARGTISGVAIDASAKAKAWEAAGLVFFPVGNIFSLYGKLGFYRADTDVRATGTVPGFSSSGSSNETNNDLTYGVGAKFDITRNVAGRIEWQKYNDVGGDSTGKTDIDVLNFGVTFRF